MVGDRETLRRAGRVTIFPLSSSAKATDPVIAERDVTHNGAFNSILVFTACPLSRA
jgi:hypothetical protein